MIHPEYDPIANEWFYGDVRAPTVGQLLQLLPSGTQVADYYTNGERANVPFPVDDIKIAINNTRPKAKDEPRKIIPVRRKPQHSTSRFKKEYDENAILDLWGEGYKGPEIEKMLNITNGTISNVLARARDRGDARAKVRNVEQYEKRRKQYAVAP